MTPLKAVLGFLPFVLFSVLAPLLGAGWSAASGAAVAVVVVVATARGGIKSLPVVQAVILIVMAAVGLTGGGSVNTVLVKYGPAIAAVLMGVFIIETARTRPFTAQFARSEVPPELWHTSQFLDVNRRISTAWGLAVLVAGLSHVLGGLIGVESMNLLVRLAVDWVVPFFAFKQAIDYTKLVGAQAHRMAEKGREMQQGNAS